MVSLRWAAQCYCRITEQLIETNDSNNGTLSPQAGFVVGLISVAVVARRTSHHADPSKAAAQAPLFKWAVWDSPAGSVQACRAFSKPAWQNVNMFSQPLRSV